MKLKSMKPLQGIYVLDLSQAAAGPMCGSYLAALGAEVIKLEHPIGGDMARRTPPYATRQGIQPNRSSPEDISSTVLKRNRGKKSVAVDLKTSEGLAILHKLVACSDIVLENFRPGVTKKLGVDYESLFPFKQNLIYCSITGFGMSGPYKNWSAFDTIIQGMSGVMASTGFPDGPPTKAGLIVGDTFAPLFALSSILAALRVRDLTGSGDFIEVSMFDCLVSLVWDEPIEFYAQHNICARSGNRLLRMAPWNSYRTSDGHVVICAGQNDHWVKVCGVIGREELVRDERFMTMESRLRNVVQVDEIVEGWTSLRTRDQVVQICQAVGVPCGPVNELTDLVNDPHLSERELLKPMMHPDLGTIQGANVARFPVRFRHIQTNDLGVAPALGRHTREVLRDRLNLDDQRIDKLQESGVIGRS